MEAYLVLKESSWMPLGVLSTQGIKSKQYLGCERGHPMWSLECLVLAEAPHVVPEMHLVQQSHPRWSLKCFQHVEGGCGSIIRYEKDT